MTSASSAMMERSRWIAGLKRSMWPTMTGMPLAAAESTISRPWAAVAARGFSMSTGTLRARQAMAAWWWWMVGTQMLMASGPASSSSSTLAKVATS